MMTARVLLSILSMVQGLVSMLIDLNCTHATNPEWPGHARFHLVWQSLTAALLSVLEVCLVWADGPYAAERFYLAVVLTAISPAGFLLALASKRAYRGTLSDPNGIPPLLFRWGGKVIQVDGNTAAVSGALLCLAIITIWFYHAARSS